MNEKDLLKKSAVQAQGHFQKAMEGLSRAHAAMPLGNLEFEEKRLSRFLSLRNLETSKGDKKDPKRLADLEIAIADARKNIAELLKKKQF